MASDPGLRESLIAKSLRVPAVEGPRGEGAAAARQLDIALMSVGFKCSGELLERLSGFHPAVVRDVGQTVLNAARALVGDHVQHNVYFVDFPENVPDTVDFWTTCIADALADPRSAANVAVQLEAGAVNLLDLPRYGRYQHTYEQMLAAHAQFIPAASDRVTLLTLGGPLAEESHAAFLALAASGVPLSESDLHLLRVLAELHVLDAQPERVPVRETRAVINAARFEQGVPLQVDTPIDLLRLACALSGGDVSLSTPTRLRSFRRAERRRFMEALDGVVRTGPEKLADVRRYAEPFKRLGERLHPHEFPACEAAQDAFAVARGERSVRSLAGRVELALAVGDASGAIGLLSNAPGMLFRSADRLARAGDDQGALVSALRRAAPSVSTRVLLSLREHLLNRQVPAATRVFVNQQGRSWITPDERAPLHEDLVGAVASIVDDEILERMPMPGRLVVEPAVRTLAVPITEKMKPGGVGIIPRGSVLEISQNVRFFVHWKEHARTTDYDLSVLLLDEHFGMAAQVSWTNLREHGVVHSGDITEAPAGASEFIDVDLGALSAHYVVPQVNIYAGESFDAADEAFFGFMQRERVQEGRPFEPRTVRAKSDLSGRGRVSLPVVFIRQPHGGWLAKWMHLNLSGRPAFNRVEGNRLSTSLIARALVEREYLTVAYVEDLMRRKRTEAAVEDDRVTYLGIDQPEDLPPGSAIFTPLNLTELLNSA